MKTKTSMNKKMFLALAVVAALAAVSFAGIALQSDDSDADTGQFIPVGTPAEWYIEGVTGFTDNFYSNGYASTKIIVRGDAASSGTINIGDYNATTGKYDLKASLTIADAKNVVIYVVATGDEYFFVIENIDTIGKVLPEGSFDLVKGTVILGDAAPFNGTITAGTFSAESVYTIGLAVGYDGTKATIFGGVYYWDPTYDDAYPDEDYYVGSLTLSGAASVESTLFTLGYGDLWISEYVKLTIADGAVITVGDIQPVLGDVTVNFAVPNQGIPVAVILDGEKIIPVANDSTTTPGKIILKDIELGKTSDIFFIVDIGTGTPVYQYYYGSLAVVGSGSSYTATLSGNRINAGLLDLAGADVDALTVPSTYVDNKTIEYTASAGYSVSVAATISDNNIAKVDGNRITFETGVIGTTVPFIVVLKKSADIKLFLGTIDASDVFIQDPAYDSVGFKVVSGTAALIVDATGAVQIRPVSAVDVQDVDAAFTINSGKWSFTDSNNDTVYIDTTADIIGKIVVTYNDKNATATPFVIHGYNYGTSSAIPGAKVLDNGTVEYGVEPVTFNNEPLGNTISAAWYVESSTTAKTYYYLTLANAIGKSDEIHISGDVVILYDITLGVTDKDTKIYIDAGASLTIGDDTHSPIVTVPANTDIYNGSGRADGYDVYSGQAVFDKAKAEAAGFAAPTADVTLVKGDKIIYTDVATAIGLATSGDVIDLLRAAWIRKDVTIIAGVTLNDNGNALSIAKGATLTVNGTYTSTGRVIAADGGSVGTPSLVRGIIGNITVGNGGIATFNGVEYEFTGVIDILAGGKVIIGDKATTKIDGVFSPPAAADAKGSIQSAGELILGNGTYNGQIYIDKLTLTGSAVFTVNTGSFVGIFKILTIGAPPTLLSDLTNNVDVDGVITLDPAAYALVYGESTFSDSNISGTPEVTVFLVGNTAKYIGKTYATEYTAAGATVIVVPPATVQLKDFTLVGWFIDSQLSVPYVTYPGSDIGVYPVLYGNFTPKQYEVTLSYNEGVEWTVNGIGYGTSKLLLINYGDSIRVDAKALPGYTGTPTYTVNGSSYTAGAAYTVTGDAAFVVSGISTAEAPAEDNSLTLIEILLIIIVIIIGIIMIVVAIKLLRS
ncbi:MAG: hypothetical protein LBM39_00420 [Candidatus Methanoplasma sp.]|jgi:hypothetical protein|nr:hypothetical protein [Candidatus Methanoplasma sp.]